MHGSFRESKDEELVIYRGDYLFSWGDDERRRISNETSNDGSYSQSYVESYGDGTTYGRAVHSSVWAADGETYDTAIWGANNDAVWSAHASANDAAIWATYFTAIRCSSAEADAVSFK